MSDAEATAAARALARAKWGNTKVVRSAQVVIERAAELPESVREQLHEATGPPGGEDRDQD
jgi:hypothetical protein